MKSVGFKFNLDEKVTAENINFSGVITLCAIQGDPANPEIVYFVQGAEASHWLAERLLKEAE
jgi:hypothetical protein